VHLRPGQRRDQRRIPDQPPAQNVRWQPGDRPAPAPKTSIAGESALYVDHANIPATVDVTNLASALGYLHPDYELMAYTAAYTGLRWGETTALTADQIDTASRVISVDRKIIEIGGKLHLEAPKGRKKRRTIYPGKHQTAIPSPSASPTVLRPPAPNSTPEPTPTA
jgi:3D (Asp-Asp-Asp) domain-containing protein